MSEAPPNLTSTDGTRHLVRRHIRFGWSALLVFLLLGISLEGLLGLKVGFYLDVSNEVRRLTWRLAHAHGVLFALINLAFALSLRAAGQAEEPWHQRASRAFIAATILLPGGFFLGGLFIHGGDPGLGIFLVPLGALCLLFGVGRCLKGFWHAFD